MDQRNFFGIEARIARIGACGDPREVLERRVVFPVLRSRLIAHVRDPLGG